MMNILKQSMAAILLMPALSANADYSHSFLDALGGTQSAATDISNTNQVVGWSYLTGDSAFHAASWLANGNITDLATLGGTDSRANAINQNGLVTGWSFTSGDAAQVSTVWSGASPLAVGALNGDNSYGSSFVNTDNVIGASDASGDDRASVWLNTGAGYNESDLGTLGGNYGFAAGSNASGQIVGESTIAGDAAVRATLWSESGGTYTSTDVGTLGGDQSFANAINDNGNIVGYAYLAGDVDFHAALWTESGGVYSASDLNTLGGLNSLASDINNNGLVVGYSEDSSGNQRAALWENDTIVDLNSYVDQTTLDDGWLLSEAAAINSQGYIVGSALNANTNEMRAFLLTPTNTAPIPEPSAYLMMLFGLIMVGLFTRKSPN